MRIKMYHKQYIEEQYRLAYLDYKTAKNEDEKQDALRRMHRLVNLAAEMYGFDYADTLSALSRHERSETA